MTNLNDAIAWQYPTAIIDEDYDLGLDPATGLQVIGYWNDAKLGPKPVESDLIAAYEADQSGLEADIRAGLQSDIDLQVPDVTVQTTVRDPVSEADIARYLAAATDKSIELEDTAAEDLGTFDPTIEVAPPQNGKGYSQFAVDIRELEPWAGAPDNNLGFEAVLNVQTEYEDQGAEARLYVIDAPSDSGAVLPFVVDAEDPSKWIATSRDGHKWADPDLGCRVQLLWGAGSLPTSSRLQCKGQNDRQAQLVRYAVPTARALSRGRKS